MGEFEGQSPQVDAGADTGEAGSTPPSLEDQLRSAEGAPQRPTLLRQLVQPLVAYLYGPQGEQGGMRHTTIRQGALPGYDLVVDGHPVHASYAAELESRDIPLTDFLGEAILPDKLTIARKNDAGADTEVVLLNWDLRDPRTHQGGLYAYHDQAFLDALEASKNDPDQYAYGKKMKKYPGPFGGSAYAPMATIDSDELEAVLVLVNGAIAALPEGNRQEDGE